jgi:hypothetical protein
MYHFSLFWKHVEAHFITGFTIFYLTPLQNGQNLVTTVSFQQILPNQQQ